MNAVEVAVALPLRNIFSYRVPDHMASQITVGCHVMVPFRKRRVPGLVVTLAADPRRATADVIDVLDVPPLPASLLKLAQFVADYYAAPLGEVVRALLPPGVRPKAQERVAITKLGRRALEAQQVALQPPDLELTSAEARVLERFIKARGGLSSRSLSAAPLHRLIERGLLQARERVTQAKRANVSHGAEITPSEPPILSKSQKEVLCAIEASITGQKYHPFLLHGVTGSGKTEIYLQAAARALAQQRTALILVPEIALTPQLAARFRARFGNRVAVLHSELPAAERLREWHRLQRGEAQLALGARSAVFAPLSRIGLVVVDEEHDASYKQQDGVRYHARDLALVRARDEQATAVLGSATPSLESFQAARTGRYHLLQLPLRVTPQPLPEVEILDLRVHQPDAACLSGRLRDAVRETLSRGQQAILFLNRRGFATLVLCRECGFTVRCSDCSVSMVWHRDRQELSCHWCGRYQTLPQICPNCKSERIEPLGAGTERIESMLAETFPGARIGRIDRDVTSRANPARLQATLDAAAKGEIDLIVGTQMIAKGHDLPGVTLVGVVLADVGMGLPDFRAAERTFQLITQVAGRAGRGSEAGLVLVQTFQPDHPSLKAAAHHDYAAFYEFEAKNRAELNYPPFGHLVLVRLEGEDVTVVEQRARALAKELRGESGVRLLGPGPAPIARLRGKYRWHLALKSPSRPALRPLVRRLSAMVSDRKGVRLHIDVDPVALL